MSLMHSPVGVMLIHRTMIEEELERNRHPRLPERNPLMTIRTSIGKTLIAAGTRLAPNHDRSEPAVGRLATAR